MAVRNLEKIFRAQSVAIIGASQNESSLGHTVVRNVLGGGFEGDVFPVNPKYKTIDGLRCYARIADLPAPADMAIICTPAATVPAVVRECGEAGIMGLVIISAGFRESGTSGAELEEVVLREAAAFDGLRMIGPNCLGIMAPHNSLNASFASGSPSRGHVAFLSQSGAVCTAVLDWAKQEHIGFSYFVSVGNMLDVTVADLIDYFASDPWTKSIIMYVESITEAREFMSAARAFARRKPIIAYKAGRFAESAQAAASHTGAMAGVDTVYQAAFNRAGIVRVMEMTDIFDCAELLARQKLPKGPRLAIVTNAGGPGVMAIDALLELKGALAQLTDETMETLNQHLPPAWSHNNPVDVLGDASPQRLAKAVDIVLADEGVDAALVVFAPQAVSEPTDAAEAVIEIAKTSGKPILTSWMGGVAMQPGVDLLNAASIPTYPTPEAAVRAFMYLVTYARTREVLSETPRDLSVNFPLSRNKRRFELEASLGNGQGTLSEDASKNLLEAYEIPVAKPQQARSADEAVEVANEIGYPVALKVLSPQITHKTDVGGVALDIANDAEVREAYDRIVSRARELRPDATVEGVTVQKMVTSPVGRELIVGAKRDAVFGSVLLVGAGGTEAELFKDIALELPPLSERLARRMLESLRSWPLLTGYRGRPPVNIDRLVEVLMRISYLIADSPEISEMDVNPLLVTPDDVIALDARIIVDPELLKRRPEPYSHLAIHPYPEEYTRTAELKDGTQVLLRAIKPEDEPMWHELLKSCSEESIWYRFMRIFKEASHEMAARFCYIDYDREIAIVAELERDGERKLIGVGRLVADADHTEAEYAVLVADAYQGRGLGGLLTDYCLEICKSWGIRSVVIESAPDNRKMLRMSEGRGFTIERCDTNGIAIGRVALD